MIVSLLLLLLSVAQSRHLFGPGDSDSPFDEQFLLEADEPVHVRLDKNTFFHRAMEARPPNGITLSVQADISRIERLRYHADRWQGPITAAIMVRNDAEKSRARAFVDSFDDNSKRLIDVHLAENVTPSSPYPINAMRNLAMQEIQTEWVYVIDIDEDTVFSMQEYLREVSDSIHKETTLNPSKTVFVASSFQWTTNHLDNIPTSKEELVGDYDLGLVIEKHPEWIVAYQHPDCKFSDWRGLSTGRKVAYTDWFEPYFIAKTRSVPSFDDSFAGFGFNAHQQAFQMGADGFQFFILPKVFNFATETMVDASRTSEQKSVIGTKAAQRFWRSEGLKHAYIGCNSCVPGECFKDCPAFQTYKSSAYAPTRVASMNLVAGSFPTLQNRALPDSPPTMITAKVPPPQIVSVKKQLSGMKLSKPATSTGTGKPVTTKSAVIETTQHKVLPHAIGPLTRVKIAREQSKEDVKQRIMKQMQIIKSGKALVPKSMH